MNCAIMDRVCQARSRDGDDGTAEFTHLKSSGNSLVEKNLPERIKF